MTRPAAEEGGGELELRQFLPTHESLGILVEYLGAKPPFDAHRTGAFVSALKHQLARRHHLAAFRGERLVGYCGWLYVTTEMGERWLARQGELKPVPEAQADAAALTIVRADEDGVTLPMMRAIRRIGAGKRIFFRRDYEGETRPAKRQTVLNVTEAS